jgi:hypothetical protein
MPQRIRYLAFSVAAILSTVANAAGIDSRAYNCADLHSLIAARGFVFVGQPAFGDFVVSGPYFCTGGQRLQLRSVPTLDRPECPVNYCETRDNAEQQ